MFNGFSHILQGKANKIWGKIFNVVRKVSQFFLNHILKLETDKGHMNWGVASGLRSLAVTLTISTSQKLIAGP